MYPYTGIGKSAPVVSAPIRALIHRTLTASPQGSPAQQSVTVGPTTQQAGSDPVPQGTTQAETAQAVLNTVLSTQPSRTPNSTTPTVDTITPPANNAAPQAQPQIDTQVFAQTQTQPEPKFNWIPWAAGATAGLLGLLILARR